MFCIHLQADFDVQLPLITVCHISYEVLSLVGDPYEVPDGIGFSFLNVDCIILKQRNTCCRIITAICITLPGTGAVPGYFHRGARGWGLQKNWGEGVTP